MKKYTIDCEGIQREGEFWDRYVDAMAMDEDECFGRGLDAFWDAISAGGPGWPGACEIELINTGTLMGLKGGAFYASLVRMSAELSPGPGNVKLILPPPAARRPTWKFWQTS